MRDAVEAIKEARNELAEVYKETQAQATQLNNNAHPYIDVPEEEVAAAFGDTIAAREAVNVALLGARDRFHGWVMRRFEQLETDEERLQFRRDLGAHIIPAWRDAEGMTLREAADALDLVASTLSRWESMPEERWPSWETAVAIVPRMHLGDPSLIPLTARQKKPWMPHPFPDNVGERSTDAPGRALTFTSIVGVVAYDDEKELQRATQLRLEGARASLLESVDKLRVGQVEMLAHLARWPEAIDALRFPPQDPLRQALDPVLGAGPFQDTDAQVHR